MDGSDVTARQAAQVARRESSGRPAPWPVGFSHIALLYRDGAEYLRWAAAIAADASRAGAPLHILVPSPAMRATREALGGPTRRLLVADMAELGRNPARIIAAGLAFADDHPGQHVYCLWEPAWPGRSEAEMREVVKHEALCNLALAEWAITVLCLYDSTGLAGRVIGDAKRTHPAIIAGGRCQASAVYQGPGCLPPGCDDQLPPPAADAESVVFDGNLRLVREFSARHARAAGLHPDRISDLVLAVSEIAANSLGHAAGGGVIRCWCTNSELLCQIEDSGQIGDPLAGRRYQSPEAAGGHGLWLTNRLCDLVETRTGPAGTTTRLHMRRRPVSRP